MFTQGARRCNRTETGPKGPALAGRGGSGDLKASGGLDPTNAHGASDMKTDNLIRALAADTPAAPSIGRTVALGLPVAGALALLALWATLGLRDDLVGVLRQPVSAMRIVLSGALFLAAIGPALALGRPEGRASVRLWPVASVPILAGGLFLWAWLQVPASERLAAVEGQTLAACLVTIPLLSLLPVAIILWALRRGATTAPALAGTLAGLAGSGLAAAIYALHCTEDSPLFYVTWYGLGIVVVTLVSRFLGKLVLRW